jgi:hypothetical protein
MDWRFSTARMARSTPIADARYSGPTGGSGQASSRVSPAVGTRMIVHQFRVLVSRASGLSDNLKCFPVVQAA